MSKKKEKLSKELESDKESDITIIDNNDFILSPISVEDSKINLVELEPTKIEPKKLSPERKRRLRLLK